MKLFFRKYGAGPPLILLHGLFGSSDNWVHIARALDHCYTVYLPDMRNHGRSPWSDVHDYNSMADDIIEFAADQGLEKFFIAGHSMGGKAAVYCVMKRPEMISGLFVGDISPFPYVSGGSAINQQQTVLAAMNSVDPGRFIDRNDLEQHLVTLAGVDNTRHILAKNIVYEAGKLRWRLNVESLSANIDKLLEGFPRPPDTSGLVATFPVIFLRGGESNYINDTDINDIPRMFPGAHILTADGAGHWVHVEQPDAVIRALKEMKALSSGEECN